MTSPPANRRISRSSSASISAGGRSLVSTICRLVGLQRVGEPEQLRLHLPAVGEELHVVHQQHVDVEEPLAVRLAVAGGDRRVKRLDELVQRQVLDREPRVDRPGGVARCAISRWVLPRPGRA